MVKFDLFFLIFRILVLVCRLIFRLVVVLERILIRLGLKLFSGCFIIFRIVIFCVFVCLEIWVNFIVMNLLLMNMIWFGCLGSLRKLVLVVSNFLLGIFSVIGWVLVVIWKFWDDKILLFILILFCLVKCVLLCNMVILVFFSLFLMWLGIVLVNVCLKVIMFV